MYNPVVMIIRPLYMFLPYFHLKKVLFIYFDLSEGVKHNDHYSSRSRTFNAYYLYFTKYRFDYVVF